VLRAFGFYRRNFYMRLRNYVAPLIAVSALIMSATISACSAISNYPPPDESEQAAATVSTITTQKIVLVDANGHERGQLGVAPGGVGLALSDETGKPRIALVVDPSDHPGVTLYNASGSARASIQLSQNGDSGLALYDDSGRCHIAMVVSSSGVPSVTLFDQAGNPERPSNAGAAAGGREPSAASR
jgi:hypothetical protein